MALAIKSAPTLFGEVAEKFEQSANRTEQNPGTQDYRREAKTVREYLRKIGI